MNVLIQLAIIIAFSQSILSFKSNPLIAKLHSKKIQRHAAIFFQQPNENSENKQGFFTRLSESKSGDVDAVNDGFDLKAWFNPNTRGGVLVWCFLLTLFPTSIYYYFISLGYEDTTVGAYVGALFVLLSNLLWASTYIFRVANKDMTYAQQLRDYENAVLQKRLEELADDEINALMEEIELEDESKSDKPIATTTLD